MVIVGSSVDEDDSRYAFMCQESCIVCLVVGLISIF